MRKLLTVKEAASYLRLSASTLNRLRVSGGGPKYYKLAGRVLYDIADLDAWIDERKHASTSDKAA
jgi:excisionase family DNA binding protein